MIHLFSLGKHAPGIEQSPGADNPTALSAYFVPRQKKEVGVGKQGRCQGNAGVSGASRKRRLDGGLSAVILRETNCPLIGPGR